jgi:hypothetical protein
LSRAKPTIRPLRFVLPRQEIGHVALLYASSTKAPPMPSAAQD